MFSFKYVFCVVAGTLTTLGIETGWSWCLGSAVFLGLWVLSGDVE